MPIHCFLDMYRKHHPSHTDFLWIFIENKPKLLQTNPSMYLPFVYIAVTKTSFCLQAYGYPVYIFAPTFSPEKTEREQ